MASRGLSRYPVMMARTELAMFACVQGTIFGRPVVPPVNIIMASSGRSPSGVEVAGFGSVAASRWTDKVPPEGPLSPPTFTVSGHHRVVGSALSCGPSASISTTRAPAAWLRTRCSVMGSAGSSGTTTRSARDAASKATTNSALLPMRSATRSPGSRPDRVSWPASSSTRRARSRWLIAMRSAVTTSAGASGSRVAATSTRSAMRGPKSDAIANAPSMCSVCGFGTISTVPGSPARRPIPIR